MKGNLVGILVLKRVQYIFSGLGRILITGLLLTTALSTHSAAAEDKLIAENPSSDFSFANKPQMDSATFASVVEQDINWGQVVVEDHNPSVEFSSLQTPQEVAVNSDVVAKHNADFKQKLVVAQNTDPRNKQKQPQLVAQTYSSGVVAQQIALSDIQGNWAQSFIELLNQRGIIEGFPDGTFRPDEPVTRAQFAAMLQKAFQKAPIRNAIQFVDLPGNYWGKDAIETAYKSGFLEGYPGNIFKPDQNIPRVQALVALATGLNLAANTPMPTVLNTYFQDASQIPDYALRQVTGALESNLIVNYPNVQILNPNQIATRADVAAFIYQALVKNGTAPELTASETATQYIVGYKPSDNVAQTTPSVEELRQRYRVPSLASQELRVITSGIVSIPGSSVTSPTAFGAEFGDVFAGASYQSRTRYFAHRDDGGLVFGFGLGERQKVALEVAVSSFSTFRQGFFNNGGVSFKLHHSFSNGMAIAAGVENAIMFGSPDAGSSVYGVVSKIFPLKNDPTQPFSSVTVSLGVGGGRFRSEQDVINRIDSVNVFGSVGVRVLEPISLIADWTGQDLTVGASIAPFRNFPMVITPAVADITGNAGDGARFILGVGFGYSF
ncbi:MAG: S-layer homology domain-containing protein [Aulosira sp. ZfuVER01]|nr:S-layer homology domain-containing protein [Aulosira sp. ZfuVER01]MDZ8002086.1 S-layer homology domain-containing protein [Aulosira sp. DedVER01a]MDZ8052647.1 S-layer homology domain-containing protein [Aulosira sp. ZfuCHP01]